MRRIPRALADQQLAILGVLFVMAGTAVAYGDTGYAFLSAAFAAVLALSLAAGLLLAAPLAFWPIGRAIVFAVGSTFFLDVAYVGGGYGEGGLITLLAGGVVYLIIWRKNTAIVTFATTAIAVSTVFILSQQALNNAQFTPIRIGTAAPGPGSVGRPYVHVILDEMGSLALMPRGPYYDDLKRTMVDDYRRRGFDLFQNTAASSGETVDSLGQVLAAQELETSSELPADGGFDFRVRNSAADRLAASGYAVTVLQSSYLELCPSEQALCLTYELRGEGAALSRRLANTADALDHALRATAQRLLTDNTDRASVYVRMLAWTAGALDVAVAPWQQDLSRPPLVVSLMEETASALGHLDDGEAVILHFLLPHYPYLLDEHCRARAPDQAFAPRWVSGPIGVMFEAAATERAYWEQVACTHDRLMAIVDAILASPGGEDALIVVHGDHGSRLYEKQVDGTPEAERRSALLAHFAVRGLDDHHDRLATHHRLRDRVWIVLNAILDAPLPESRVAASAAGAVGGSLATAH